ncbi:RnfH family protein [Azohydromonas sediminis]|uniref:RnfH family protein n=1 Tax=Azohydromonas sediminis TaxID=2259674 RepID=UPI001F45DAA4|nr:RnfH family protein [Azohydromonas sediminis]
MSAEPLRVEVVYSPAPRTVHRRRLELAPGSTVADAVRASGVLGDGTSADLAFSVWGRLASADQPLRDLDRVEVCRPLTVDPKEARRLRYRGKTGRRGSG